MNTAALPPEQWGLIFTLLSMDISKPLYGALGLGWLRAERFMPMLRNLILENRRRYMADPSTIPPLADRVLEELERSFGRREAETFYAWALHVFLKVPRDQPHWSTWQILFHRFAYNAGISIQMGLPVQTRDELRAAYRQIVNMDDVEQMIAATRGQLLSEWDLEMYSIHQFSEDANDPLDILFLTAQMHRFQLFWKEWLPRLSEQDKANLWQRGQKILKEMGLHSPLVPAEDLKVTLP